jgi:McrBC 5-methylcytosine restriction system component
VAVVAVVEGVPFRLQGSQPDLLRRSIAELEQRLKPGFRVLEERADELVVRGVVGTIRLGPNTFLDVAPKTVPGDDWIASVLALLGVSDPIQVAGDRRSGLAAHRNLYDVLASLYAERLLRALRREGPLLLMERRDATKPVLKGRLNVSAWTRKASWRPHVFPVSFQELTSDNDFSRALAHVATLLARSTTAPRTRGMLLDCARNLRPGAPEAFTVRPQAALRSLPSQWAAYQPAWDIAVAVLSQRSLLGTVGHRYGVSLAIEAWPLLERLLEQALRAAVSLAEQRGQKLRAPGGRRTKLLAGVNTRGRSVVPDGRLIDQAEHHLATFEAKYARSDSETWPPREHYFQALATAAACGSDLAVLVYPAAFEPVWWSTDSFNGKPRHLVAIGLGLFDYRRGVGDVERGRALLNLLDGPHASAKPTALVA